MKLRLSNLPPLDFAQRWISRVVWGAWFIWFLVVEGLGTLRWTPWRTLSETGWDVENEYPGARRVLQGFLLGLVVHIRYRTTFKSSIAWGMALQNDFDKFVASHS